jgi:presenilin-like A22 family membrane protease
MKHTLKITLVLTLLFLAAQIIGLFITNQYISVGELPYGIERPELEESASYIPLIIAILIATGMALLLIKFNAKKLWKFWFIFATVYLLGIAFSSFIGSYWALGLALILGLAKFFRPSVIIHNFTELFIYSGIAAIFAPIMSVLSVSILLILISIYDYIAVRKTKHMVAMAKFQAKARVFAGLLIPYDKGKKNAILGGGDIGFTLLFAGVILNKFGFLEAIITAITASVALFMLFMFSKKNKFYPAMPFLSIGCFVGLLISYFI